MRKETLTMEDDEHLVPYCLLHNIPFETEVEAKKHKTLFDCDPVRIAPRDIAYVQKDLARMRGACE